MNVQPFCMDILYKTFTILHKGCFIIKYSNCGQAAARHLQGRPLGKKGESCHGYG